MVKERGRRQSGGTISLSERGENRDGDREEEPLIPVSLDSAVISNMLKGCSHEVCHQLSHIPKRAKSAAPPAIQQQDKDRGTMNEKVSLSLLSQDKNAAKYISHVFKATF